MSALISFIYRLFYKMMNIVHGKTDAEISGLDYWERRAKIFGPRSVINIGHPNKELESVTENQVRQIFPHLLEMLDRNETTLLDFGCGVGRFTSKLASTIQGVAIGVDPIGTLLDFAPKSKNVEYLLMQEGRVPLEDGSVDVVWICLVMGGIQPEKMDSTISEIRRVLKPGGLVFLVENTSEKPSGPHWVFRNVKHYQDMFAFAALTQLHTYEDLGETISVMAGRSARAQADDHSLSLAP